MLVVSTLPLEVFWVIWERQYKFGKNSLKFKLHLTVEMHYFFHFANYRNMGCKKEIKTNIEAILTINPRFSFRNIVSCVN